MGGGDHGFHVEGSEEPADQDDGDKNVQQHVVVDDSDEIEDDDDITGSDVSSHTSDGDGQGMEHALSHENDDSITSNTLLGVLSDDTGRFTVIEMIHKICFSAEVDLDEFEEASDTTGRYMYLLSCRRTRVRPVVPAVMQMSGSFMLLQHHGLKDSDVLCLSAAIAMNRSLTHLDLSDNQVGDRGAIALANAFVHNSTISTLFLGSARIGCDGGEAWGKALGINTGIRHLEMQANRLGDKACSFIIGALTSNKHIHTLNLADNQLGIKSASALRDAFEHNTTLRTLDLSWNHIRPQDLSVLLQGLRANTSLKTLSLAWNGIGDKSPPTSSAGVGIDAGQRSPRNAFLGGADAGDSLVAMIRQNTSITDLDVSSCRLGSHLCKDLAGAIAENRSLQYLLLDGNPLGDGAVAIIKEIKARMLAGSMSKFSMDNCCFDPVKRHLDFDPVLPSGHYRLDLADPRERDICKKLIAECKLRKQDIFRNERIDERRVSLTHALVAGGYEGNYKGWDPPPEGVFEVDISVMHHADKHSLVIHQNDFRILTRAMESTGSDSAKLTLLKQALAAYHVDCNQAMMLLLQFGRDASRELAFVIMFTVMTDRKNIFLCHAALSERSRYNLHKRLGPLYMMNRTDPASRYWFDLAKKDDQRALRVLLHLANADPTAAFHDVHYAAECDSTPLHVDKGSDLWLRIFTESHADDAPGTPDQMLDRGILELSMTAQRKGEGLRENFMSAAKAQARGKTEPRRTGSTSGGNSRAVMSKTVPAGSDVLTINSRPNTTAGI
jgi:Leucine-rich repeat (LRR) protein